jgi:hypothetical protein
MGRRVTREQITGELKFKKWLASLCHPEALLIYDRSGGNALEGSGHPDLYVNCGYLGSDWAGWVELKWQQNLLTPIQRFMAEQRNHLNPWDSVVLRGVRTYSSSPTSDPGWIELTLTAPGLDGEISESLYLEHGKKYDVGEDRRVVCALLSRCGEKQEEERRRRIVVA